jgi:hypothetical protein
MVLRARKVAGKPTVVIAVRGTFVVPANCPGRPLEKPLLDGGAEACTARMAGRRRHQFLTSTGIWCDGVFRAQVEVQAS